MKGATVFVIGHINRKLYFNPRTREGCDHDGDENTLTFINFNPRTREGCDGGYASGAFAQEDFNPRTREGCDSETA